MTEKQFNVGYFDEPVDVDDYVECNGEYLSSSEVVDRLNELNDKKDELKRNYNLCVHRRMNDHNEIHRLEEENKELKKENEQLKKEYLKLKHRHNLLHDECLDVECERDNLKKEVGLLEEENEQLKSQLGLYEKNANARNNFDLNICCKENNRLSEENKHLKQELQKIYDISTVNKVKSIVDEIYDDLLYETSEESDYARKIVLKCLEKIDNFGDDLND